MALRNMCCLLVAVMTAGCPVESQSCTEIGCGDGISIELRPAEGTLDDGSYALDIVAGEQTHACSFVVPDDLPVRGNLHEVQCMPRLNVYLQPESICSEQRSGDAISESCRPVPGRFMLQAQIEGTPRTLDLRLSRDGTALLEQQLTPSYETTRPNGPDCEPACEQARVQLAFP